MSTHREMYFWTRVKLKKVIIFTILESTSIKYGRGGNQHKVKKNSGRTLSVDARKINCAHKENLRGRTGGGGG